MTEREKLIELLEEADQVAQAKGITDYKDAIADNADHLLSSGVIVPPCKVGDKVYKITRNKVKECKVVHIGLSADERCSSFNFIETYEDGTFYKSYSMVFDVIGKTVFLTKEEAERALAERSNNEQGKRENHK